MKLKCNVCHESPVVEITTPPDHEDSMICCQSCDKRMAYATTSRVNNKLVWHPLDTDFDKDWGGCPVTLIEEDESKN